MLCPVHNVWRLDPWYHPDHRGPPLQSTQLGAPLLAPAAESCTSQAPAPSTEPSHPPPLGDAARAATHAGARPCPQRRLPLEGGEALMERHRADDARRRPVAKGVVKVRATRRVGLTGRPVADPANGAPGRRRRATGTATDPPDPAVRDAPIPPSPSDAATSIELSMESDNTQLLAQDESGTWVNGVARLSASGASAARVLGWVIEHTSRKVSVIATDKIRLDGFHNWEHVHAGSPNDERQRAHTFIIARAQRRQALAQIPGLSDLVAEAKGAIASLRLRDMPTELEWLHGHILNQADVNARFEYHQDTGEERNTASGRRDRRVLYTAIVKLNRGGCTSMQVCGMPEVFYHSPSGSGVLFRSDLHHRTAKAEPGVWKLALFFGVYL